jgi:hypothetical protein
MASFNDLTEEEQRRAREREDQLLADLEAAEELERLCDQRARGGQVSGEEYVRARRNLESARSIVESLEFDLLLYRLERNDKDTVVINCAGLPQGYGENLGKTLSRNTMVTTLALTTRNFLPTGIQTVFPAAKPLRDFLLTSSSVVNMRVCDARPGETPVQVADQVDNFMRETACASDVIQYLTLRSRPVSPLEFKSLMTTPKSLRKLDVQFANRQRWTDEEKTCITEGLEGNANRLQRLVLHCDGDMSTHVLNNVHRVNSLQELELVFPSGYGAILDVFSALERYLQSTNTLLRLWLIHVPLRESLMASLLSGLGMTTAAVPRITVSEVSLQCCSLDTESSDQLFEFLQTPTTDEHGTTVYESALRQFRLSVDDEDLYDFDRQQLTDEQCHSWWERLAESLLVPLDGTSPSKVKTIGSQIEELQFWAPHPSFLFCLGINKSRVRVKHLGLYGAIPNAVSEWLPNLGPVTSLTLKNCHVDGGPISAIVEGLKLNGSITVVSTGRTAFDPFRDRDWGMFEPEYDDEFDDKQHRLMQAYAQRNKFLRSYKIGQTSAADDNGQGAADAAPLDDSNDCGPLQVGVSQAPSILRTAMLGPVPHLWLGLMKSGEQCGPDEPTHVSGAK